MGTAGLDGTHLMKETERKSAKPHETLSAILAPDTWWIFMANHTHMKSYSDYASQLYRKCTHTHKWEESDKSSVRVTTKIKRKEKEKEMIEWYIIHLLKVTHTK